jgi:outer membrane receptor protein involved in Fe transport
VQVPYTAQLLQYQNAARARYLGAELGVRGRPLRWFEVWGGWTSMSARRLDKDPPNDNIDYHPNHKGIVAGTFFPVPIVGITLVGRYVGAQRFLNIYTNNWGEVGGYGMLDARVDVMATRGLRLWVRGTNLADQNVQGRYGFPEAGRQLFVGAALAVPEGDYLMP